MSIAFLFVTCCLEPSRFRILSEVVENIKAQAPELLSVATVFDNASSEPGTQEKLISNFKNVYSSNRNVGYWTAVSWWLKHIQFQQPKYTYIVESDMIHYEFNKIWKAAKYLDDHPHIGAVRLHEYVVALRHLYNKDAPTKGSKTNIWQSHTNKISGKSVHVSEQSIDGIHEATFLTQLPALNRYQTMCKCFSQLEEMNQFSELDFQRYYFQNFATNSIVDGGIFHCDPGSFNAKAVTGSWTSPSDLAKMGYYSTRFASIMPPEQYTVTKLV